MKLKLATPGKLNRPAWYRTRTAELGPDHKTGEGVASLVTAEVYLDGEVIGSVTGAPSTEAQQRRPRVDPVPDRGRRHAARVGTVQRHRRTRPYPPDRAEPAPDRPPGCLVGEVQTGGTPAPAISR
jgi:hypothetical protein